MVGRNEAKIRFTAETKDLTAQIKSANSVLASMKAALKLNDAEFRNTGDSAEYLKNKQNALNTELEANKSKQEALNGKLEAAKRIYGEDSVEAQRLVKQLTDAKTEEENLKKALSDCETEMEKQTAAAKKAETPLEKLNSTIESQEKELEKLKTDYANTALEQGKDSKAAQDLKKKIDDLNGELQENKTKLNDVTDAVEDSGEEAEKAANGGWSVVKQMFSDLATNAISDCIQKIKEVAKSMTNLGIDFSSSMSNVQALSGASEGDLARLEKKARELGSSTVFSAKEVADAFGYMALAGWDTGEMLGGIEGVLNLAAAGGMDLARASDIVTDGLTAFGLEASDATDFADTLATTMSKSNTDVEQLGEAFKYVAPVAGQMGYSVEDVSLALGTMANSGIKASQGGTSLRRMLQNMISPSDKVENAMKNLGVSMFNADGTARPLIDVMEDLRDAVSSGEGDVEGFQKGLEDLSTAFENGEIDADEYDQACLDLAKECGVLTEQIQAQDLAAIGGSAGMAGLMTIVGASEETWSSLAKEIDNSKGSAEEMAKVMNDNLGGDLKTLNSAWEELQLKIYDVVEGPMRDFVTSVTEDVIPALEDGWNWINQHRTLLMVMGGVIGTIVTAIGLMTAVQAVQAAMNAAEATSLGALIAMKLASAAASMAALAPYILIVAAIAAVIAIIVLCVKHWDVIKAKILEVAGVVKTKLTEAWNKIKTATANTFNTVKSKVIEIWTGIKTKVTTIVTEMWTKITTIWSAIKNTVSTKVNEIKTTVGNVFENIKTTASTKWNEIKSTISNAVNSVKSKVSTTFNSVKSDVTTKWNNIKTTAKSKWDEIKISILTPIKNAKEKVSDTVSSMKEKVTNTFTSLKTSVGNAWDGIKDKITGPINSAKTAVSNAISKIKDLFPVSMGKIMNFSLPKISVSGGTAPWGIGGKGTKPSFSVSWESHAAGALFKKPVLLPGMDGLTHMVGDNPRSPEAVAPIEVLQDYVTDAVERAAGDGIDYDLLANKMAVACARLNVNIDLDGRTLGRVVREMV